MNHRSATVEELEQLTGLFRLLSDKTRLNILFLLVDGERNVTGLCESLHLPQPTVSHHLGLLRTHNVIANRRSGKQIFYALERGVDVGDHSSMQLNVADYCIRIGPAPAQEPAPAA